MWKGADSRRFVAAVLEMLSVRKLKVGNVDITLLAQAPKVSPYRLEIRRSLAQMLGVTENQVNIKATTTEHLGFIGRNEGLAAQAIVLLEPMPETRMIPEHWRRAALAPPAAWGAPLGSGVLRATPEDFEVDEILGFAAGGEGPHALLRVRKRGANTEWVARELARAAGVQALRGGFRGAQGSQRGDHAALHRAARQTRRRGIHRPQGRGLRSAQRRARTSASCRAARSRAIGSRSPCAGCAAIRRQLAQRMQRIADGRRA